MTERRSSNRKDDRRRNQKLHRSSEPVPRSDAPDEYAEEQKDQAYTGPKSDHDLSERPGKGQEPSHDYHMDESMAEDSDDSPSSAPEDVDSEIVARETEPDEDEDETDEHGKRQTPRPG